MSKNTILTIALIVVAALAIYFAYQSNENKKEANKSVIQKIGDEIDDATDEVGHEIDEMQDESKEGRH